MSKVTEKNVNDLAKKLASDISIEDTTVSVAEGAFYTHAPKGISEKVVTGVRNYESEFIAATEVALENVAKDIVTKDTESLTMEFSMGEGSTGTHTALKNTEKGTWNAHTEIDNQLNGGDVFIKCQLSLVDTLNNL